MLFALPIIFYYVDGNPDVSNVPPSGAIGNVNVSQVLMYTYSHMHAYKYACLHVLSVCACVRVRECEHLSMCRGIAKGRPGRAQAHPHVPANENLKKSKYSNGAFKYSIKAVKGPDCALPTSVCMLLHAYGHVCKNL